jgi:hypothetical protein
MTDGYTCSATNVSVFFGNGVSAYKGRKEKQVGTGVEYQLVKTRKKSKVWIPTDIMAKESGYESEELSQDPPAPVQWIV